MGSRTLRVLLMGAALVATLPVAAAALDCNDPCLQAARSTFRQCTTSANAAFLDRLDGCLARDHTCVNACRWTRRTCRDATGLGTDLAACQAELDAAKARCRARFPLGSGRRERCIDEAQVAANRCRTHARRTHRRELRSCAADFEQCVDDCGTGAPPNGVDACRADARAAAKEVLADCRQVYIVSASACLDKDATCVQGCGDERLACAAPTQAALADALAACAAQAEAAVSACIAANPDGGTPLDDCVEGAQAVAAACADAALDAAAPGIAACVGPFVRCVRACPKE